MNDVLERNVARLIAVAPPASRLSNEARGSICAALQQQMSASEMALPQSHTATGQAMEPRPRLRLLGLVAAAAAVLLCAVLGFRALSTGGDAGANGTDPTAAGGTDTTVARLDQDELTAQDDRTGQDAADATSPSAADREAVRIEGSTAEGSSAAATQGTRDPADGDGPLDSTQASAPSRDLSARISLAPSVEKAPEEISVWVRAAVQLPLVADPVVYKRAWPAGARSLDLALEDALALATPFGVDKVRVQIEALGVAPARGMAAIDRDPNEPIELVLRPGRDVRGFVIDKETKAPIAGALVVATHELPIDALPIQRQPNERLPQPSAITDASGAFHLRDVGATESVRLRASHDDYAPTWGDAERATAPETGFESVSLGLGPGGVVHGYIERPDGTRWSDALVIVSRQVEQSRDPERPSLLTFGAAKTSADGSFRVRNLPPGVYVVLHFGDPTNAADGPVEFRQVEIESTESIELNFVAQQSGAVAALEGRFLDREGAPVAEASLLVLQVVDGEPVQDDWRATQTGANGRFTLPDLPPGEYQLFHASDGYMTMQRVWSGALDGPTVIDVRIARTRLSIRTTAATTGAPVAGAWVLLESFDSESQTWQFAGRGPSKAVDGDREAIARFDGLAPGRYRGSVVGARKGLGSVHLEDFDLGMSTPATRDAEIPPGGILRIRVTETLAESPVVGARVAILDGDGRKVPIEVPPQTDADGLAAIQNVPFGSLTARVFPAGAEDGAIDVAISFEDQGDDQAERVPVRLPSR